MNILLLGATGFIGRHLARVFSTSGHRVIRGIRKNSATIGDQEILVDYTLDTATADWLPRVTGMDVVINAVGLLRGTRSNPLDRVHVETPKALFQACEDAGVRKVIQISSLGADANATSAYHVTKRTADRFVAGLDIDWVIVQPSVVYGDDGASSRFFRMLSVLPFIPVPGRGEQLLQPIHIDDLCSCMLRLLEPDAPVRARLALVGPQATQYRTLLASYRAQLGLTQTITVPIPMYCMRWAARLTEWVPGNLLTRESLTMLERGNVADSAITKRLLGKAPRPVDRFIRSTEAPSLRTRAMLDWLLPHLRVSLAIVWLWSGLTSAFFYPTEQSLGLLSAVGLDGIEASIALYMLIVMDIALAIATLVVPSRRLWRLQLAIVFGYTLAVTIFLPAFWLHPFGPLLKNLPILAVLITLLYLEER